jgi:hypothetical protein
MPFNTSSLRVSSLHFLQKKKETAHLVYSSNNFAFPDFVALVDELQGYKNKCVRG